MASSRSCMSRPALAGGQAVDVLGGVDQRGDLVVVEVVREGELEQDAVDRWSELSSRSRPASSSGAGRRASSWWKDSMPTSARVLALHAHVDRGSRIVAHQHGRQPGRDGQLLQPPAPPFRLTRAATAFPSMITHGGRPLRRASSAARSRPSACARSRRAAKRTTTRPPGSTPMTTPSPKWACITSSPSREDRARAGRLGRRGAGRAPGGGRLAADGTLLLAVGQVGRDLVDEAAAQVPVAVAEQGAGARVGEVELALGARDAHVGQPSLLLQVARLDRPRSAGTRRPPCRS